MALSRLFSSGVIRELASKGQSPLFARLIRSAGILSQVTGTSATVANAFDLAFSMLRRSGVRDEYVFRSALTRNVLLGRHTLRSATMLTEFRVESSKVDLAILNGTSTAYEIKSDRDSLSRLDLQISNYRKIFASVYVIAGDSHISNVLASVPNDVGVMRLARWNRISTVRHAINSPERVSPLAIVNSLRASEAEEILQSMGVAIPVVPNTMLRTVLRDCFAKLTPSDTHREMVRVLKKTRAQLAVNALIKELPASLHTAALAVPLKASDHNRLVAATLTPLDVATIWE